MNDSREMRMRATLIAATLLVSAASVSTSVDAAVLTQMLGDQDFTDGQAVGSGTFTAANAGDPAPFNTLVGSDVVGPNFSASWTYSGAPIANVASASILIGLYEGDSSAAGDQAASFTLNGTVNLTALLNTAMNAKGGLTGHEDYYTVNLPAAALTEIATGQATFSLTLQNGLGVLGPTDFNGAGLDFATLTVVTQAVPEPAAWSLSLLLGVSLLCARRFSKRR
jgi:hypothetical protein